MSSKLERLLAEIDPAQIYDRTFARANTAVNRFEMHLAQITDWNEFTRQMAEFFIHIESNVLNVSDSVYGDLDFHWGRCLHLLGRIYGTNGEKAAFEMARTGNEGGRYAVFKAVALRLAEEHTENEIAARVSDFLAKLSVDELWAEIDDYLQGYGHLLPAEMTEGGAVRIRVNFSKVLAQHPKIVRQTRNIGR